MTPNGPRCRLASVTGRLVVADWPALPIVYVTDWSPPTGPIDLLRPLVPHRRLARIADWFALSIGPNLRWVCFSEWTTLPIARITGLSLGRFGPRHRLVCVTVWSASPFGLRHRFVRAPIDLIDLFRRLVRVDWPASIDPRLVHFFAK